MDNLKRIYEQIEQAPAYSKEAEDFKLWVLAMIKKEMDSDTRDIDDMAGIVKIQLRGKHNPLCEIEPYFDGAEYVCIDVCGKIDTGEYGFIWYE